MSEWICDDRVDVLKLIDKINAMTEEEKRAYIEEYEKSLKSENETAS